MTSTPIWPAHTSSTLVIETDSWHMVGFKIIIIIIIILCFVLAYNNNNNNRMIRLAVSQCHVSIALNWSWLLCARTKKLRTLRVKMWQKMSQELMTAKSTVWKTVTLHSAVVCVVLAYNNTCSGLEGIRIGLCQMYLEQLCSRCVILSCICFVAVAFWGFFLCCMKMMISSSLA